MLSQFTCYLMSMRPTALRALSRCAQSSLTRSSTRLVHTLQPTRRCFLSVSRAAAGRIPQGVRCTSSVVSSNNILSSPFPDEDIPVVPFAEYIFSFCDTYRDHTALVDFLTGRSYTYTQLKGASMKVASALTRFGYKKGDVIAVFSTNIPEYTVFMLGAASCGITVSPANPLYSPGEIARHLKLSGAKAVFTMAPLLATLQEAMKNDQDVKNGIRELFAFGEADGCKPFAELLKDDGKAFPENVTINPKEDVLILPFSSGTTGMPKGVMLTHHNCVSNVVQCRSPLPIEPKVDRLLGILPFYHIYGMVPVQFGCLQGGGTLVILPRFDPEMFLKALDNHKISILHIVPPIVLFLAKFPLVSEFDLSSLKYVVSGAAPLGEGLTSEFQTRLHAPVYQGYGLTESSPVITADSAPGKPGTIGLLVPNTEGKFVCVETGKTLGPGEFGEYCARGPQVMKGYLDNPEATRNMLDEDGWLHTGDLGFFDEDGYAVIEDRLKELIKYKGFQVPPAEVEAVLLTHPDVQDTAVIGIPDDDAGELPRAYVVPKPGASVTKPEIMRFVEEHMAPYKRLRGGVEFVDEIPKSLSGKILRRVLKEALMK